MELTFFFRQAKHEMTGLGRGLFSKLWAAEECGSRPESLSGGMSGCLTLHPHVNSQGRRSGTIANYTVEWPHLVGRQNFAGRKATE